MNKIITLSIALMLATISTVAQTYNEDDKEGLRMFLRQPSAEAGKINAEQLGLEVNDTLNWQTDETWITKVASLTWNNDSPKRLIAIYWPQKNLAGALDASKWSKLTDLNCPSNQLTALDVSTNIELKFLTCANMKLAILDVSANIKLQQLQCYNNLLTSLDVSANMGLTLLWCSNNQLTALDVNANTKLTNLDCSNNQLTELNLSTNTALITLSCTTNRLNTLDLSTNTAITTLYCDNNPLLTALDLSANTALTTLYCDNNPLTALNVSGNTKLKTLRCSTNQLTTLDVSGNTALTSLWCINNRLTTLNVSANTELTELDCSINQLTTLDVSANTKLTGLYCHTNCLPLSDLFAASEKITVQNNKTLGPQNLLPQTIVIGSTIDYSDQSIFGGKNTQFIITKNNSPAPESDYTLTPDGKITFTSLGNYTVTMTNEAIVSRVSNPAKVIVDVTVKEGAGIGTFNGMARDGAVSFTIGDVVYVGSGYNNNGALKDFWKYSKENNTWVQIADFAGAARTNAVAFTLNGKAYVGLGHPDYLSSPFKDFYEYDPSTNQWTKCANDFGGTARSGAVCFVIENKAYVGTGADSNGTTKDFWSFDGTNWTQLLSKFSGEERSSATSFVINNKAYISGGFYDGSYFMQLSDIQEYDPATDTWTEKEYADGLNLSINGATAFTYNGIGYICYGNKKNVISYDPVTNKIENMGDEFNFGNNRDNPISFLFQGIPYVGLGSNGLSTTAYYSDIVPFSQATGVKTPAINAIQTYPNPVSENFRIKGITDNTFVTIFDISGKIVLQRIVAPDEIVSVSHLSNGAYIVCVADKKIKMIKR